MRRACCAAALLAAGACSNVAAGTAGVLPSSAPVPARGVVGDTVRVIINHVLADKRGQFEHFTHEILLPAMTKMAPVDSISARQMHQARLLHPTRMEPDSTYAYVFIVDPVVTSRSYSFPDLFTRAYGSQKADEYMRMFRESLARPSDTYLVTNASW